VCDGFRVGSYGLSLQSVQTVGAIECVQDTPRPLKNGDGRTGRQEMELRRPDFPGGQVLRMCEKENHPYVQSVLFEEAASLCGSHVCMVLLDIFNDSWCSISIFFHASPLLTVANLATSKILLFQC
jgi:hypothetical protein